MTWLKRTSTYRDGGGSRPAFARYARRHNCDAVPAIAKPWTQQTRAQVEKKKSCVIAEINIEKQPEMIHDPMVRRFPRDGGVAPSVRVPGIMTYSTRA